MLNLDGKAYGLLFTVKDNKPIPPDEFIVFRVYDKALLATLDFYYAQCVQIGADDRQLAGVKRLIDLVKDWQAKHPERCKVPDLEPGEMEGI